MGEVYSAQDTRLDRKVAIKFLHEEFSAKSPEHSDRFEIGEVDGKNYIATKLTDGQTPCSEHLSHKESLQLNQILKIGLQVSEALSNGQRSPQCGRE